MVDWLYMSGEIKFRRWDKEFGEMEYQYDLEALGGIFSDAHHNPDQYELMQYIGIRDKNDKEIYEGDVVADVGEDEPCIHKIIWDEDKLSWNLETRLDEEGNFGQGIYDDLYDGVKNRKTEYFEIIGNIYENPELIKERSDDRQAV